MRHPHALIVALSQPNGLYIRLVDGGVGKATD
jgi:hypothetical protein